LAASKPSRKDIEYIHPDRVIRVQNSEDSHSESEDGVTSTSEDDIHDETVQNCQQFLELSHRDWKKVGWKDRYASTVVEWKANIRARKEIKTFRTQTQGIDGSELRRRKAAGECQRCPWPEDITGGHKNIDCQRAIRKKKGNADIPT